MIHLTQFHQLDLNTLFLLKWATMERLALCMLHAVWFTVYERDISPWHCVLQSKVSFVNFFSPFRIMIKAKKGKEEGQ